MQENTESRVTAAPGTQSHASPQPWGHRVTRHHSPGDTDRGGSLWGGPALTIYALIVFLSPRPEDSQLRFYEMPQNTSYSSNFTYFFRVF